MATNLARFTPRAVRVLTLAEAEARQLNHNYVGTEHLLLGLVQEGEGLAAKVLLDLGVTPRRVRQRLKQLYAEDLTARGLG
jgi:ATP-dependent Clp protease ATP-binding subunit ClpC